MTRFLLGFSLPFIVLAHWAWRAWSGVEGSARAYWVALILGVPLVVSWLTVEAVQRLRPRRAFDPRAPRSVLPAAAGLIAAVIGAAATGLALPFVDQWVPDAVIVGACAAVPTVGAVLSLPRRRAGYCVCCGYDLRGAPTARCPECGGFRTG